MRFIKQWDILLINMLNLCPSEKPILSAYPPSYAFPRTILNNLITGIKFDQFRKSGIVTFKGSGEDLSRYSCPQLGAFIAGGFNFALSSIIREVPSDPNIYFFGEEFLTSVRAWTRGWDIYHPHQVICWHYYNSELPRQLSPGSFHHQTCRIVFLVLATGSTCQNFVDLPILIDYTRSVNR